MITEIDQIQRYLDSNPRHTIGIVDADNPTRKISTLKSIKDIRDEGFEDLEEYFRSLHSHHKSVSAISVQTYKPNGSNANKRFGIPLVVKFSAPLGGGSQADRAVESPAAPTASHHITQNHKKNTMSETNQFGLGLPEIMDMTFKSKSYDELKGRYEGLKAKYEAQDEVNQRKLEKKEDEIAELTKKLRNAEATNELNDRKLELELLKRDLEKKPLIDPETQKALAEGFASLLPILASKGKSAMPGMGSPDQPDNKSDIKKGFMKMVEHSTTQDVHCSLMKNFIEAYLTDDQFRVSYDELYMTIKPS